MSVVDDPTCLSLDDIIKMNKSRANSRAPSVAGSVKSFRSQRSQGGHSNSLRSNSVLMHSRGPNFQYQGHRQFPFWRNFPRQPRRRTLNQLFAQQRVRRAAHYLNNTYPNRRQIVFPSYRLAQPRWRQPGRRMMRYLGPMRPMVNVYGPQLTRLSKMELVRQRLRNDDLDNLTVSVANDRFRAMPPLVDRNVGNLNRANLARHNAAMGGARRRSGSPSGSVATRTSRASRRQRQRRMKARSLARSLRSVSGLNPSIQRAIATIQGKTVTGDETFVRPASLPAANVRRPTPYATGLSLHDRFSSARCTVADG